MSYLYPVGNAKAPAVDLSKLNTVTGTKNAVFNP